MRSLIALHVAGLLCLSTTACGAVDRRAARRNPESSPAASSTTAARGDQDNDDGQPVDNDRQTVRTYGHEAPAGERLVVASLLERYFKAAAAHDGAAACRLIDPGIAKSAPRSYGQLGPPYLHGARTCAAVMSRLFEHYQHQLDAKRHGLKIPSLRVEGEEGVAMLDFPGMPERDIALDRRGGSWHLAKLLDEPIRVAP